MYLIDRKQGTTEKGHDFGYIRVGTGGIFFQWRYNEDAPHNEQVRQVVATMEDDEIDPPTGSQAVAERSLRHHIAQHGLA